MWTSFRNFFLRSVDRKPAQPDASSGPTGAANSRPAKLSTSHRSSEEINSNYYSLILGVHSLAETELNSFESEAQLRVGKLIRSKESRENLVPRLPAIVPKLMRSIRDDDASGADLAGLIGKDATLVAEVIRIANSPYYRTVNKIRSLEQAVLILGRTGIRHFLAKHCIQAPAQHSTGIFHKPVVRLDMAPVRVLRL